MLLLCDGLSIQNHNNSPYPFLSVDVGNNKTTLFKNFESPVANCAQVISLSGLFLLGPRIFRSKMN